MKKNKKEMIIFYTMVISFLVLIFNVIIYSFTGKLFRNQDIINIIITLIYIIGVINITSAIMFLYEINHDKPKRRIK